MRECHEIGIAGNCGVSCELFLEGKCSLEDPQAFKEDIIDLSEERRSILQDQVGCYYPELFEDSNKRELLKIKVFSSLLNRAFVGEPVNIKHKGQVFALVYNTEYQYKVCLRCHKTSAGKDMGYVYMNTDMDIDFVLNDLLERPYKDLLELQVKITPLVKYYDK